MSARSQPDPAQAQPEPCIPLPAPAPEPAPAPAQHPTLGGAIDVRNAALVVLALLGSIFMLHWAQAVLVPMLLGLTLSYALAPLVDRLARWHLPRAVGAALVLVLLLGSIAGVAFGLRDEATAFVESLPQAAQKVRQLARASRNQPETTIEKVQKAATELEKAATESSAASTSAPAKGVTLVQIERPRFSIHEYLLDRMPDALAGLAQATIVIFLTFFLLASGDSFRRKAVALAGPTFTRRRITVQALDEITDQVQRYLRVQVLLGAVVGLATWLAYWAIGIEQSAVWGVLAMLLNFIPYIGAIVVIGASALAGFVQFGSVDMGLLVGGTSIALRTVSGYLLAPWLTSRASRINPVAVFVGMLVFGWLWGLWGLLLGTPVLLIVKAVCDRVDDFRLVGALLER